MTKYHFFIFFACLLLTLGCKSLLSPTEAEFKPSLSLDALAVPQADMSSVDGASLEDTFAKEAEALIKAKEADLSSYYENYLDSLKVKLKDSGSVKIKGYEGFLVNILSDQIKNDTVYLANLVTKTDTKGTPLSFQYSALKNDKLYFEIECLKNNGLSELLFGGIDIEFVEGAEVRYQHFDLKKRDKIIGSFKVLEDNPVILNITKRGYTKAALKVKVKKTLGTNLIVEKVTDSLEQTQMVVKEVSDTIYHLVDEKQYTLAPQLDITNGHQLTMPLLVEDLDNLLGWGFWIGLNEGDVKKYNDLLMFYPEDPLKLFARSELVKNGYLVLLPVTEDENLVVNFKNLSEDKLSLNSTETYGFFSSDSLSNDYKGELRITNRSKLYDYMITVKTVGVNVVKSKVEEEETTYTLNEYINISVVK
ncbi:hypothetical protein N9H57_01680 [Flavobacteriaceae bacterium]|nr:hypothetical protein [Flavobacteriaceae bacterium]MDA8947829.1 hypothetical protein [Flavobacteriaceae bacterium]